MKQVRLQARQKCCTGNHRLLTGRAAVTVPMYCVLYSESLPVSQVVGGVLQLHSAVGLPLDVLSSCRLLR